MKFGTRNRGWGPISRSHFALLLLLPFLSLSQAKIQDWERRCVVGECVPTSSGLSSCKAQPMDIKLGHPTQHSVRSDPIFRNRPMTMAAESCSVSGSGGLHRHHNDRRGRRQTSGDGFIPLCCPEKKTREGMLVGGLGAAPNEFPHQVRLLIKSPGGVREKCGGTIYNKDYVLTAASCLVYNGQQVTPADVEVITGQNLEHTRIPRNIHTVRDIKIHEGYKGTLHSYGRDHDIALLRLKNPIDFGSHRGSAHLKALRIPEKGFRAQGRPAIILGWGRVALEDKPIGALLKMNTHINTNDECTKKSKQALHNGNDFRKTKLELETPHDEFGVPDTFDLANTRFSSKSNSRNFGFGSDRKSLFDDDPFFSNWRRGGSSLNAWEEQHELVKMGALQLEKLWEGGVEYSNSRRSNVDGLPSFPPSLLCLGGGDGAKGYSRGDSGGPAICDGADGTPVLCGISSYGRNQFRGEWPATYVNVAHYSDWIHSNTGRSRQPEDALVKDIIDGEPVSSLNEASFFIRIRNKKTNTTCGGALINSRTVVSSVACVPLAVRVDDLVVTSGEFSVDSQGNEHEVEGVSTRETYKSYQPRSENRRGSSSSGSSEVVGSALKGDFPQLNLAVLKLARPVRAVKPIDLIKPRMERMIAYEYGWRTDGRDKTLNKWAYREVPLDECKARFASVGIQVDDHHLCAHETYSGGEKCNKELGNPLVCMDRLGKKYLCGVTSIRDCSYAFPTVFTNVVQNLDWIQL